MGQGHDYLDYVGVGVVKNWANLDYVICTHSSTSKTTSSTIAIREVVKNIQRGGYLKIAAKGREALTPPKIWVKCIYPP